MSGILASMRNDLLASLISRPSEYSAYPAEHRLWIAVLLRAVSDTLGRINVRDVDPRETDETVDTVQREARHWLEESGCTEVGSYLWICDQLELDPEWTRTLLVTHRDQLHRQWSKLVDEMQQTVRKPQMWGRQMWGRQVAKRRRVQYQYQ